MPVSKKITGKRNGIDITDLVNSLVKEGRLPKQNQHLFRIEEGTEGSGGMLYNHLMIITYANLAYLKIFYMLMK